MQQEEQTCDYAWLNQHFLFVLFIVGLSETKQVNLVYCIFAHWPFVEDMRAMKSTKNVQYIYNKLTFFFTLKFIVSVHKFIFVDCFLQDSVIYDVQTVLFFMI